MQSEIEAQAALQYRLYRLATLAPGAAYGNSLSLAFPLAEVEAWDGVRATPAFVGLLGIAGTLPYHYTERLAAGRHGAAGDFMQLLSAPAVRGLLQAWQAFRPELAPGAGAAPPPVLRARSAGEWLAARLGVPVRIEQCIPRWQALPAAQRCALGTPLGALGKSAFLGGSVLRLDLSARLHIGPLGRDAAAAFAPGGAAAVQLAGRWAQLQAPGVEVEVRVHLAAGAARGAALGAGARLGHDSFLLAGSNAVARDDLRYRLC